MLAFLQAVRRTRGDLSFLVFAAFLAFAVAPQSGVALSPQSAHFVLLWLEAETPRTESVEAEPQALAPPAKSLKVASRAVFEPGISQKSARPTPLLEAHEAAYLSGVRTNIRLN